MEVKARDASLWAKIAAGVILLVGSVLKWVGVFTECTINELCIVAFTLAGLFGTVDINLMFEKIWGKKND
jgi:uncharacterized membrane protein